MAIKIIKDTAGYNGLILNLLVFGAYPRIVSTDKPAATIARRTVAVKPAMAEVTKLHGVHQVKDVIS